MKAALDLLLSKRNEYGFSDRIVLFGASAGGHLSALQAYKYSSPNIRVVVDMFGPTDMADLYSFSNLQGQAALQILMGGSPTSNPTMYQNSSPVNFVNAQSAPTIIFHGDQDEVVDKNQSIELKNALVAAGVPVQLEIYQGLGHELWPPAVMDEVLQKVKGFVSIHID